MPLRPAALLAFAAVSAATPPAAAQPGVLRGLQTAAPLNVQVDRLSVQDGLSTTTVSSLLQDRTGFLWVGTEVGLDRYDGYGFTTFRHDPEDTRSLSSSFATALAEDRGGRIWVGTYGGGLNRLDPATGHALRLRHRPGRTPDARATVSSDRVEALLADRRGRIWAGTSEGLDVVDPASGRVRRLGAVLRRRADVKDGVNIRDLAAAPNGDVWAATFAGLFRVNGRTGRVRLFLSADSLGSAAVTSVWADRDGTVWAGLDGAGLVRVSSATGAVTRMRHAPADASSLCSDAVQDVIRDTQGVLWVATRGGGLCRLQAPTVDATAAGGSARFVSLHTDPADDHSLSTDEARVLASDRSGVLWAGTWGGGLNRIRRTPFERFRALPADGFRSEDVMTFAEAGGGRLWVGTYDAGLHLADASGRALPTPGLPQALREMGVRSVLTDRTGTLWATGDARGLWRRSVKGVWTLSPFPPDAGVRSALRLALGPDGTVWIAAYGPGLCRADPETRRIDCPATRFPVGRRLSGTEGYAVHANADGTVWVSLWGVGVDLVDPAGGRIAHFENDAERAGSLPQNTVTAFARDRLGRLWMGTYGGGLARYEPPARANRAGTFHAVGVRSGLPDETVYALVPDLAGALWVTTNRGMARFDPVRERAVAFGTEDGLQSDEFNAGAALALADGRIVAGGIHGYNRFDPTALTASGPPPPVVVTAVRVMGVERPLAAARRLRYDETAVSFTLAALDFTAPQLNRFATRLDGLDAAWTPLGTRHEAAYTNLSPGHYTLRVRAASSAGVWGETAVPFEIRPAWWQTAVFRGSLGLALLAALVAAVRTVSQRGLRAELARLAAEAILQDERARISRDLHDHVGAQLSTLLADVELVRLERGAGGTGAEALDSALVNVEADARETMAQLRESIWALGETDVTLGAFRDRLAADLRQRLRSRARPAATVTLDGPAAHVLSPEQALHLYRIAREACTNSLKHAGATRLDVHIVADAGGAVMVEVSDDGQFVVPDTSGSGDGAVGLSGFGLDSMRTRAAALGGRFEMETDAGTTVRVTVPAGRPARQPV
ncbi:MAG TPA: two-component regulator propeller domain-containing protein [Rubricoccaceae bacterium]|jgi:signal transduction histidine kinase/ligand-binding sensor domain-containing protein